MHPELREWITTEIRRRLPIYEHDHPVVHHLAYELTHDLQTKHDPPIPNNAVFIRMPYDDYRRTIYEVMPLPEPLHPQDIWEDALPVAPAYDTRHVDVKRWIGGSYLYGYEIRLDMRLAYSVEANRLYIFDTRPETFEPIRIPQIERRQPEPEIAILEWREAPYEDTPVGRVLIKIEAFGENIRKSVAGE